MIKAVFLFLLCCLPGTGWAASYWISPGLGGEASSLHQTIASTSSDINFNYLEPVSLSLSAEKILTIFETKTILGLHGSISQAIFQENVSLGLARDKLLLYGFSSELKASLFSSKKIFALLGLDYSTLPALARPASLTDNFSYRRISTQSALTGIGTSLSLGRSFFRSYLRVAFPFRCGGECSASSGLSSSLRIEYGRRLQPVSTLSLQGTGAFTKLSYDSLDLLEGRKLRHQVEILSFGLSAVYSHEF